MLESWEDAHSSPSLNGKEVCARPFFEKIKKSSLVLNQCFANAYCSYQGESALSSALPIWGFITASKPEILFYSYTKSFVSLLKEHGYSTYFSPSWDPIIYSSGILSELVYSEGLSNKIGTAIKNYIQKSKSRHLYSSSIHISITPFVIAGIQKVADVLDEDFPLSSLDQDIFKGDIMCKNGENPRCCRCNGDHMSDQYTFEKLYNKITKLKEPFFVVAHTFSSHRGHLFLMHRLIRI